MTLAGATVASVWGDIFHHPDDEAVLDDTLNASAGCIERGTGFPDGRGFGKCVPEFAIGMGCGFRLRGSAETMTHNLSPEWDAVSQRGRKRKVHPTPDVNSGTRFPDAKKAT